MLNKVNKINIKFVFLSRLKDAKTLGIIKNTILKMRKTNKDNLIYASIGPCIGKKSYEVDLKFYKKFITMSKRNIIYSICMFRAI